MGKQKRERRKPHKKNPTGLPNVEDLDKEEEELDEEDKDAALQRMIDQLESPNIEEKLSGLQTLESMCTNAEMAMQVAKGGVARIAAPLLVDENNLVRAASASALRNIANNGGEDACNMLLEHDVMTPLAALLQRHYTSWQPKPKEKGKIDDEKETFIQAITLLWTLCENDEHAIKYSNEGHLISILIKCLDISLHSLDVNIIAAQCMLTLSEDNPLAISELKKYEGPLLSLLKLKTDKESDLSNVMLLKTLSGGLLMNINNSECTSAIVSCQVATALAETLAFDHRKLLNSVTSTLPVDTNKLNVKSEKKLNDIKKYLTAQQQALEILANLCSEDPQEDMDSDLDDSDPAEEENDFIDDDVMSTDKFHISTLPIELTEVFASLKIIDIVWEKTILLPENVRQILFENPESKTVLKHAHVLRCRAFLCLNNLISTLDVDGLGGVENLYRMWVEIGNVVFKEADQNDIALLESATAAMRAALQKLVEVRANVFSQLSMFDIQVMLNGEQQCPNPNVRVNLVRIVGNLALVFTNTNTANCRELVKHLSIFLLDACAKEPEVWVIAECLDAIMDIFAEDETNEVAAEIELVDKLRPLVQLLNNKIRQQKKRLGDNFYVVSTVKTNLNRFIKYKSAQLAKLK
ncbi:HEAT repeat-containing protein 3 [Neodiprion virginianus]|uniref:HEAT repeat-containing protein 3 n=1 Tax=Neodiprion virginianus TaxID=2961670 RepID=UPI001EE72A6B|nr:HEAT repeat-containing protein 3 [Neodiprion virginianus]